MHNWYLLVFTDVFKGIIKFRVGALTGDNLGLHSILGFVESFSANHPCRICTADRQQIQTMTTEDITLLRNETNYKNMLLINNTYETGIKEECIWLSLKDFNMFDNVAVDLLHDMLEGCCKYVMTFVITYFVKDLKLIHLNTIIQRIQAFDFGPDSSSKPTTAFMFEGQNLKYRLSASEMLTFVRYFGLLVGYYIPRENDIWKLYILLRTILDRLLSQRVYTDTCEQLTGLISEFNQLFIMLRNQPLKPKFHFLIHYPTMLRKFGPLSQVWTMRFEAKHSIAKKIARSSASKLNDTLLKNEIRTGMQCGKKTIVYDICDQLKDHLDATEDCVVHSLHSVRLNGAEFKKLSILTVGLSEETFLPSFAVIDEVYLLNNEKVLFSCISLETVNFDEHFYGYEVIYTEKTIFVSLDQLLAPLTNTITILPDLKCYVTVRWPLD